MLGVGVRSDLPLKMPGAWTSCSSVFLPDDKSSQMAPFGCPLNFSAGSGRPGRPGGSGQGWGSWGTEQQSPVSPHPFLHPRCGWHSGPLPKPAAGGARVGGAGPRRAAPRLCQAPLGRAGASHAGRKMALDART